jgi:tRNA (guanine-N7-)-methyltransferase
MAPISIPAEAAWRHRGAWDKVFGREAPLHVEIGSGNGFFLSELAARHPEWNVLGIEIRYKRVVLCAMKIEKAGLENARIARYHAAYLDDLFETASIAGLYVNHPDPWPKERHESKRLISSWFLHDVATYLAPGAHFRLKSDFRPNVDRVEELLGSEPCSSLPLRITGRSDDLSKGDTPWPDDIVTNYQNKFLLKGEPVYGIAVEKSV